MTECCRLVVIVVYMYIDNSSYAQVVERVLLFVVTDVHLLTLTLQKGQEFLSHSGA